MNIKYRPEIDGLRAIAVCSVIIYHAEIYLFGQQVLEGGFIGVDIFFVISGYLISSIILNEIIDTGSFSYMNFYERRIRRILPALLFVITLSLPLAWLYLLPDSFIEFAKSILYSLSFGSNFFFYFSGELYGATNNTHVPFLHTWSLSIEEQFYIIFPLLFLISFKYCRKYLLHILIMIAILSLIYANWTSLHHPAKSFYFIQTRIWELLAGSILAYFEINFGHRNKNQLLSKLFPLIGLILIAQSLIFFNDETFHPSFYTLSPVIGVCLIIWFADKNEFITKLLSSKLFVGIGLISYSLYLWHYPIFAFSRIIEFTAGNYVNFIFIVLSILILSISSYFLIEKKARNKKNSFKHVLYFLVPIIIFNFLFYIAVINSDGFKNRIPNKLLEITAQVDNVMNDTTPWLQLRDENGDPCYRKLTYCSFNKKSEKKVFLVGDSHMASIMSNLKEKVVKSGYNFITPTHEECMYFPGFDLVSVKTNIASKKCNNFYFKKLENELLNHNNSIIILGGRLPLYLSNKYFDNLEGGLERRGVNFENKYKSVGKFKDIQSSFKHSIKSILAHGNKIILIYPIPEVGWHVPKKIFYSKSYKTDDITTSYNVYKDRSKSSIDLLDSIKDENIYRVYPDKLLCNTFVKERCAVQDNDSIFYYDDDHLSNKGSELINNLIMNVIEKIEEENK
tara:strand:+ start:1905 stop:3941 length:2037 start_codon:yes stop_codon:yes gene_type:complete